ncbi:MAG: triose-phosphate isomerase [Crocinitomicaceae bacterium]|jgi:triosephosphate isomerase|nr:triose-phosphate isomerase [Crocinitomicaceae bacterium]MDG1741979.1 triose-phosphate isomerase [Crocinitomicaceae bacterium]
MAQKIVAGNWKMNLKLDEAIRLVEVLKINHIESDVRVVLFPPSVYIDTLSHRIDDHIELGVQNFHAEAKGAYTGELAINQIKSVGANIGLIGHSERRAYFAETNDILKLKVDAAVSQEFQFIFCCGEPLMIREAGEELDFVKMQLEESLFHLSKDEMLDRIIAYEPVWAIGTGKTASAEQAESMHRAIRTWLHEKYDEETAQSVSLLYGGSCNHENARELFSCPNVDGGLIGGASLKSEVFCEIIKSY